MKIVADESVDFTIIEMLRERKVEVVAIVEDSPSISDDEVLEIAVAHKTLLITEDKDFGELVIRLQKAHQGVLLLRLSGLEIEHKLALVWEALQKNFQELSGNFSVLDDRSLRIKIMKNNP